MTGESGQPDAGSGKPSGDDWFLVRFAPCQSRLYRFIARLVPNRADAEDLFQRTSLEGWRQRGSFQQDRELFHWLCGIARNQVRNYYRSARTAPLRLDPDVIDQLADIQMRQDGDELARHAALTRCLEQLPDAHRELVSAYYAREQTVEALADTRARTPDAIYKSLQRIRAALFECIRRRLEAEGTL